MNSQVNKVLSKKIANMLAILNIYFRAWKFCHVVGNHAAWISYTYLYVYIHIFTCIYICLDVYIIYIYKYAYII